MSGGLPYGQGRVALSKVAAPVRKAQKAGQTTTPTYARKQPVMSRPTHPSVPPPPPPPPSVLAKTLFDDDFYHEQTEGPQTDEDPYYTNTTYGNSGYLLPPQPPEIRGRMTVVLDMDETLVHSEFLNGEDYLYRQEEDDRVNNRTSAPDFFLEVCDGVAVRTRPWLTTFLAKLSEDFEVGVFTAAEEVYAGPVLDTIDPNGHLNFRLYRDATVEFNGTQFVKDISRLGRDMRRTVLVDNNIQATLASPDNSLVCMDYYGDPEDTQLQSILQTLHEMNAMSDIRPFCRSLYQRPWI